MQHRLHALLAVLRNVRGATAIEYGLIAALVAVAAIVAMRNLGGSIKNTYATAGANLGSAASAAATGGTSAGTK